MAAKAKRPLSSPESSPTPKLLRLSDATRWSETRSLAFLEYDGDSRAFIKSASGRSNVASAKAAYDNVYRLVKDRHEVAGWIRTNLKNIQQSTTVDEKNTIAKQVTIFKHGYEKLERDIEYQMVLYGQRSCLKLCRALISSLPREIRDLIYEYVVAEVKPISVDFDHITVAGPGFYSFMLTELLSKKHFLYPAFVEKQGSQEIAVAYFDRNAFRLHDSYALQEFLKTDSVCYRITGTVISPAKFIRHLVVDLRADNMISAMSLPPRYRQRDKVIDSLGPLFTIERPKGFRVDLPIVGERKAVVESMLEDMRPAVSRLKTAGFRVKVLCRLHEQLNYPQDLTGFYSCSRADWNTRVTTHRQLNPEIRIHDIHRSKDRAAVQNLALLYPGFSLRYLHGLVLEEEKVDINDLVKNIIRG